MICYSLFIGLFRIFAAFVGCFFLLLDFNIFADFGVVRFVCVFGEVGDALC